MRVVDTSLWIEYLNDGPLADQAMKSIEPLATCVVPAMVQYELMKWFHRELGSEKAQKLLALLTDCQFAAMDVVVANEAALLALKYKLHATDSIIYATAQVLGFTLYNCDSHFEGLPNVKYWPKPK
jgi:uncharacterized protein